MSSVSAGKTSRGSGLPFRLLILVLLPGPALAQDALPFELTPFAGYRIGGDFELSETGETVRLADAASYGLMFNVRQAYNTQWEILYSRQQTETQPSSVLSSPLELDIHVLQGGGTYQGDLGRIRPYMAATIGGTHIKARNSNGQSDTFLSFSLGGGLQIRPTDRLGLRLEARGYGTLTSSNTDIFCQTGPDLNVCAIRIEGKVLWQFEALAGIVFRF